MDTFKVFHKVDSLIQKESVSFWPDYTMNVSLNVTYKLKTFDSIQINQMETVITMAKTDDYYSRKTFTFLDTVTQLNIFPLNALRLNLVERAIVYESPDLKSKIVAQEKKSMAFQIWNYCRKNLF